ncbi:hypothetical protein JCM1393_22140 [Clostridium carnis]
MGFFTTIVYFAIMLGITVLLFNVGRKYVFSKVKINKWIPLAIALVVFALQVFIPKLELEIFKNPVFSMTFTMVVTLVIVWFFLWFIDIQTTGGPKRQEKKIEIRPKAKPNRVKHMQNQKK